MSNSTIAAPLYAGAAATVIILVAIASLPLATSATALLSLSALMPLYLGFASSSARLVESRLVRVKSDR